jgi:hypothetical protein
MAWLTQVLTDGPLPERDVQAKARIAGFTRKTLKVAKARAGVRSTKDGVRRWLWALPGRSPNQ